MNAKIDGYRIDEIESDGHKVEVYGYDTRGEKSYGFYRLKIDGVLETGVRWTRPTKADVKAALFIAKLAAC